MNFFLILGLLLSVENVNAREFTYQEKLSDLDQVVSILKSGYGPLLYKETAQGIHIDQLRAEYASRLLTSSSNAEFYYLLVQFVAEFRDSHMAATLPTNMLATLHFTTDWVAGAVVIDTVDRSKLSYDQFPFERGDEILMINGEPVSKLQNELVRYVNAGSPETAMRKAVLALPVRNGKTFPVPSGSISLLIRHRKSGVSETVRLNWAVTGEPIDELPARAPFSMPPVDYDLLTIEDSFPKAEESYRCAGYSRISIPAGATVLRKEPFVAYYYPSAKGNVGYLRIGDYFPKNSEGGSEYEERFRQYEQVVSVFQKETVGLIIDQDHNCGGSVDFMHKFMSLFMGSSFKPLQFSLLASKEQYVLYRNWMYTVPEGTAKRRNLETVFDLIKESWETGAPMTQLTAIDGMPEIASNPVHYTKPIIILIDEFAGSGGDAFPALMKGYGRAKLLGSRTMGAGGHVREFPPLYYSQIGLRLTKSLFYRPDGIPVENNGAIPDFNYAITLDDFVSGYRAYRNFYTDRLNELF